MMLMYVNISYAQSTIYEGTMIKVELTRVLDSGKEKAGNRIDFVLAEPITSGDRVVVQKGARVVGTVTEATKSKMAGRKGELNFSVDFLYLPSDNRPIRLRAQQTGSSDGKSRTTAVIAAAVVVNPLFLVVKGKNIVVQPGTLFDVFIDETFEL